MASYYNQLYFIHCMTPTHIGAGQGVGIIDMPIMRERITQWPLIPGSSVKGVLREYYMLSGDSMESQRWVDAAFGKAAGSGSEAEDTSAGALSFTDSRLLAFPVASEHGTFAYVSCPMALRRLLRDAAAAGVTIDHLQIDAVDEWDNVLRQRGDDSGAIVGQRSQSLIVRNERIAIDEFEFVVLEDDDRLVNCASSLARCVFPTEDARQLFRERFMLVSDEAFQYFSTVCCEVTPRIRISSETKIVEDGALWYEEYLPSESLLYGVVWCDNIHLKQSALHRENVYERLDGTMYLQLGGNASVGKGRVSCRFSREDGR
ncbi:type III-B CRISPR module RAMP protein Cmr4 [Paenibacillus sp. J5C_2022]|uniref:type III-B CRISPR module RAMP protein Cmr4 n=1 Tax=Paenibacillus sp. J5C2022 TaxID=2977129 RepID=UPI0021CF5C93|nr:type III-B CRISPR module RAMP protein Cmr4 [Paenibacillus sp. J5C2022]MCU6711413.1 type III-B CRISPR module RAMP protein Cmr4 [Paenibacillus sp. J5C2022]